MGAISCEMTPKFLQWKPRVLLFWATVKLYDTEKYDPALETHTATCMTGCTHVFFPVPSRLQEVSAFGENGEGDDLDVWTVQCDGVHWERDETVRFKHVGTDVFLSVTGEQYGHPIRGQREVHGMSSASHHNWWRAMEGVFIQPSQDLLRHDEL